MKQNAVLLCVVSLVAVVVTKPYSADVPPLPGPGLSYGGIPYGSMSGNVAEFFKRQTPPSGRRSNFPGYPPSGVDYSPIEQWL